MFSGLHRDVKGQVDLLYNSPQYGSIILDMAITTAISGNDALYAARDDHGLERAYQGRDQDQVSVSGMRTSQIREIYDQYGCLNVLETADDSNTRIDPLDYFDADLTIPQSFFHSQLVFQHDSENVQDTIGDVCGPDCVNNGILRIESSHESVSTSCNFVDQHCPTFCSPTRSIPTTTSSTDETKQSNNISDKDVCDALISTPETILSRLQSLYNTLPPLSNKTIYHEPLHTVPYSYESASQRRVYPTIRSDAMEKAKRRREAHNAIERRRRDLINDRISELSYLVPQCHEALFQFSVVAKRGCSNSQSMNGHYIVGTSEQGTVSSQIPNSRLNKTFILEKSAEYIRQLQDILHRQAMLLKASNIRDEMLDNAMASILPHCPNPYIDSENQGDSAFYGGI